MAGMRKKNITGNIKRKMNEWLDTIEDEALKNDVKNDIVVTGGCIASMLLGEPVNDYDVYFKRFETACRVTDYYIAKFLENRVAIQGGIPVEMFSERLVDSMNRQRVRVVVKSAGVAGDTQSKEYGYFESDSTATPEAGEYIDDIYENVQAVAEVDDTVLPIKPDYAPVFLSSNAITLKGGVQLIIRFHGGADAIHENFDFVHTMNYFTFADGVVLNPDSLEAILSKTLTYKGSLYPICSVFRTKKFIERGWKINAGQYLKMALQISKLDLTNYLILEEQLTGVDVAYFKEVLSKAQSKNEDGTPSLIVDTAYLTEVINRMF